MVKNAIGGNKAKKQGRKHVSGGGNSGQVRLAKEEGEIYAIVNKIYGANADVKCIDGESRLMIIRNKFKGRGKRDNMLAAGTWVLVGVRSWEVKKPDTREKCDLLEVYNPTDVDNLKQREGDKPWHIFSGIGRTAISDDTGEETIAFVDEQTDTYQTAVAELEDHSDPDSDIDIDDI